MRGRLSRRAARLTALVLALAMLLAFAALAVLAGHAVHDCAGENCPICDWLVRCERALGGVALLWLAAAPGAAAVGEARRASFRRTGAGRPAATPVSLGVRLRN